MFEKIKERMKEVNVDELTFEELLIFVKIETTIAEYENILSMNGKNMEEK